MYFNIYQSTCSYRVTHGCRECNFVVCCTSLYLSVLVMRIVLFDIDLRCTVRGERVGETLRTSSPPSPEQGEKLLYRRGGILQSVRYLRRCRKLCSVRLTCMPYYDSDAYRNGAPELLIMTLTLTKKK